MAMTEPESVAGEIWREEERIRIVRLCQQITGRAEAAEDLAQDALSEAWRLRHRLTDPTGYERWLSAIARNICRRWMRVQGREQMRRLEMAIDVPDSADNWDLDMELEREELATLLDRALALLPPETRGSLIARYVDELPHAEIADRLGLSEGAVAMRLQRGRVMLRRLLATELRIQAEAYGLVEAGASWQETRIWCPICGERRLLGRSMAESGEFRLRCFGCFPTGENQQVFNIAHTWTPDLVSGVTAWKAAHFKVVSAFHAYFTRAITERSAECLRCGQTVPLRHGISNGFPENAPHVISRRALFVCCDRCGDTADIHPLSLALNSPAGLGFWRRYPRLRMLPERIVEAQGTSAVVERFESVREQARLEVVLAEDSYQILSIHQSAST